MPDCPPPFRKHTAFRGFRLARGLHRQGAMKRLLLGLVSVAGALLCFASTSSAQLLDAISSIDGDVFVDDAQTRYFNQRHCGVTGTGGSSGTGGTAGIGGTGGVGGQDDAADADGGTGPASAAAFAVKSPEDTPFEIRLDQSNTSSEVILWIGSAGAECNREAQRDVTAAVCAPIREAAPIPVATDFLVTGLFLQDLLDPTTGGNPIATCDSSGLQGTEYKIFVFRAAPAGDVTPEQYGIASFRIDVAAPNAPVVDTSPQRQTNFQITWQDPNPVDLIQFWSFYSSSENDPATAVRLDVTAPLSDRSQTISSQLLGLAEGETAYIFMSGFDQAFVSDATDANESELSEGVMVTAVEVVGYCDLSGDCTGCSASPIVLWGADASSMPVVLGLLFGGLLLWRRRR